MRVTIWTKKMVGLFFAIAALVAAAGTGAIPVQAQGDNIATFSVSATAHCTFCPSPNAPIPISGTFTIDLTTGVVSAGTMFITDVADLKVSPLGLPFNLQQAGPPYALVFFASPNSTGNRSNVSLFFPFPSFAANYAGGLLCASGNFNCNGDSGGAIGPNDASQALFTATNGSGTNLLFDSGSVSLVPPGSRNPVPLLNPLVPSTVAPGGASFTLTVNGTGFVPDAQVKWNGSPRSTTFVNSDQLKVSITSADIAVAGTVAVTATNPGPGGGTSNIEYFHVSNAQTPTSFNTFGNNEVDGYRVRPSNIIAADFNGDGKLDLAAYANGFIYVLPGNGDGTFPPGGWIASPGSGASASLAAADLNGDGKLDLVLNTNPSGVVIALGNGDGTFSAQGSLIGAVLGPIMIADFNGDGFLDLAYVTPGSPSSNIPRVVQIQFGNGDGTFRIGPSTPAPAAASLLQLLAVGDFNGDGKLDLVAVASENTCIAGQVFVFEYPGNGDGTFQSPLQLPGTATCGANGPQSAAVADFNGDGKLDIAYFSIETSSFGPAPSFLSVSLGDGAGNFSVPFVVQDSGASFTPTIGPLLAGDFNGDGKLDLVAGNRLFYGNGDGSFTAQGPAQNNGLQVVQVGDFNGDGQVDLLALGTNPSNSSQSDLRVLLQVPAPPDFTGALNTTTQTVIPGTSATYSGSVTPLNGFTGNVALSASGLPSGVTASFNPVTVTGGSGNYTLTLSVGSSVALGTYSVTLTGTSGSLMHSSTVTLIVNSSVGDFSGSNAPGSDSYQDITAGQTATYTFQFTPNGGFTGNISLSVSGLPAGATASFNPSTVTGGSGTSTLTVVTAASTPISINTIVATATSGALSHSGSVFLGVRPDNEDFTGTISPNSQIVTVGQIATFTANIKYLNGFNPGGLSLSLSNVPEALSGIQFKVTNSAVTSTGETDTFTISVPPGTPPVGPSTFLLTGGGGGRIRSGTFVLQINPAP